MGANGSFASGMTDSDAGRMYKTIGRIGDLQVIMTRNRNAGVKLPEESHTPNRIYATFYRDGHDVKAIAKYGDDGKKVWEIHTVDHKNLGPHYHVWTNGRPVDVFPLDDDKMAILEKVRRYSDME